MRTIQLLILLAIATALMLATGNIWVISAAAALAVTLALALLWLWAAQARVRAVIVNPPADKVAWGTDLHYSVELRLGVVLAFLQPSVVFRVLPGPRGLPGQPLGQIAAGVRSSNPAYEADRIPCLARGQWTIGPVTAQTSSLLGILPVRDQEVLPQRLLDVLPRWVPLATCAILEQDGLRPGDGLSRRYEQDPPVTVGCRPYAPGDPLNRIHWPQTARQRTFMSRLYESPPLRQASFYLLLHLEGDLGRRHEELLVTIAASLAVLLGDARRSTRQLGLVIGGEVGWIAPASGNYGEGAAELQDVLMMAKAGDAAPLALQVAWLGARLQPGDVAVLITAAPLATCADLLGDLQARGVSTRVIHVASGLQEAQWPVPALAVPAELDDPDREDELANCLEGMRPQTSAHLVAVRAVG